MIFANSLRVQAAVTFVTGVTNEFSGLFHYILKIFLELTNILLYKAKSYTR